MSSKHDGNNQACAACKFQRRRCTPQCILRPHFPQGQLSEFLNAHRLFGVRNIQKVLESIHPNQREDAAKSIKYESHIRSMIPDHGCCHVIREFTNRIQLGNHELIRVKTLIAQFKSASASAAAASSEFDVKKNYFSGVPNNGFFSHVYETADENADDNNENDIGFGRGTQCDDDPFTIFL